MTQAVISLLMVQKKDFQSYLYYLIWIIKSFGN